jgi:predicted metal-dependent TIM-barrel fold hydrolase
MQTEKQKERLVELLNEATFGVNVHTLADHLSRETIDRVAEYLMSNNVVVLPENALPEISAKIVSEDKEKLVVEQEFNFHWKNKRTILKAKENVK